MVSTLIAILSAVVVVSFRQANKNARDSKRKADLQEIRGSLENYRLENGVYPESDDSESGGYEVSFNGDFMENLPAAYTGHAYLDPINNEIYFYRYKVRNLPGCTYELSAKMETGSGQSCAACGYSDPTYYCVTDQ